MAGGRKSVFEPSLTTFTRRKAQTTQHMNKAQIGTLWVVAIIIDTAILVALCVTVGLIW